MYIKLNHINDSDFSDHWNFKGKNLDTYLHEMEMLYLMFVSNDELKNSLYYKNFFNYLQSELNRDTYEYRWNSCCAYSVYYQNKVNGIPLPEGKNTMEHTFSVNTLGEYVVCQLIDKADDVPNPMCERPEKCEKCEYRDTHYCGVCPDQKPPKECNHARERARLQIRLNQISKILNKQL